MLIPHLHKALPVVGNFFDTLNTMRLFPKQISEEEFIYSSTLSETDLISEIKETLEKRKGLNFSHNFYGKFISEDTFRITSKWQVGTSSKLFFHSDTALKGRIYKKDKHETQIFLSVTPHSLFPTAFVLSPLIFILGIFFPDKNGVDTSFDLKFALVSVALAVLIPIVIMFLSNLSKKRLRERFTNHFNLSLISQVY